MLKILKVSTCLLSLLLQNIILKIIDNIIQENEITNTIIEK